MKEKRGDEIKSNNHRFDLWLFGELLSEAVRLEDTKGFCNLIDNNPDLAEEYFKRRMEKIEKVELPPEFYSEEWTQKMLDRIRKALEEKEKD